MNERSNMVMKKTRFIAAVMTAVMLLPVLVSCSSSGKTAANVVKEDDPWYDTTRFKLENDIKTGDEEGGRDICISDDRIFSLYCVSSDTWCSSRTMLDAYDFEGNFLSRHKVAFPDDLQLFKMYGASVDPEGKTITAVVDFLYRNYRDAAFIEIDTESGTVTNIKDVYDDAAKKAIKQGYHTYSLMPAGDYMIALLSGGYNGGMVTQFQMLLFKDKEFVHELDLSTVNFMFLLGGVSVDEASNSIFIGVYEIGDTSSLEFDMTTGKLKNKKSFRELSGEKDNISDFSATDNGDLCKIDSLGNIIRIDTNTMTPVTVIDTNWYTPHFSPPYSDKQGAGTGILSCGEDRTVISDYEYISYGSDVTSSNEYIRVLTRAEKNPNAGKEIIEIALPSNQGISNYLSQAICGFNETDSEYLIRVWDKYKAGYTIGLVLGAIDENDQEVYKMIQDLRGDDAPDIVLDIQKNYAMRDDIFKDLSDFLDPEVWDKQYNNIFEAGRVNGKLYFLPVTLEIEGLVTNKELVKDGAAGITFEEFEDLITDKMNGFSPYDYPNAVVFNKRTFLLSCIDTKSAIEGESVNFGTDQFRYAAEYAKDNFIYDDEKSIPLDYINDWSRFRGECYYARIGDFLDFVTACNKSDKQYKIIGTPSVDASGPRFKALETVSVSATTDVEDGCKRFLNYLFSGAAYDSADCEFRQIVTNREIMDRNIEILTKHNNEEYERFKAKVDAGVFIPAAGYYKAFGDKVATADMSESFKNSLSTISTYNYEDQTIIRFVDEELAPYYAGDRSLDDAIKYMNDRTTTYIREM